ncbi:major facilitator superfamily domain-containing protein [Elsinoe ampelina]|uniref:Major facilitator superfamily domain-containing protein n=1 Tax=Elsinoe ampelina TaxID=302913 RepID=A0A6A6GLW8_9PEZI|nr:major facilitator superfamily domain-containing protein [Elsinoe ampelina]
MEKDVDYSSAAERDSSSELGQSVWSEKEELRARWKVDTTVLPLLFLGLLVFQLDRMNIASALTGGFAQDIRVNQATINLGNQLMFLAIVMFEIPCNMLLQKLGPRKWISGQVFTFGLVATLQVFVKNRTGFLVSRWFLGTAESGYIPGAIYTLSTWYKERELAKRVAILFFGMFGANALSPILASGILMLDDKRGLTGWQWLFMLEGLFTIVVAFLLIFVLPGSPDSPAPLLSPGLIRFSVTDQAILRGRLAQDDPEKQPGAQGMKIHWTIVRNTLLHYRRWPHYISTCVVFSTWSPLTTYTPSIYVSLGFNRTAANALASIGAFAALGVVFFFAWLSDRTGKRGSAVMAAHLCYLITLIVARSVQERVGTWQRWALWTVVNAFAVGYHPVQNTWVQLNCKDPRERSIAIAMWVMFAISGLMFGTQYFQASDLPFYRTGLRTMIIMVSVGLVMAGVQEGVYWWHNKKVREGRGKTIHGETEVRVYVL